MSVFQRPSPALCGQTLAAGAAAHQEHHGALSLLPLGGNPAATAAACKAPTAVSTTSGMAAPGTRTLTVIHFNDVYEIASRTAEPVGGAARLVRDRSACDRRQRFAC